MRKESRPNSHKERRIWLIWNETTNEKEKKSQKNRKNVPSLTPREGSHDGETQTPVMNVAKKYDDRIQFIYRMKSASKRFNIINITWRNNFLKEDIFDAMSLTYP